MYGQVELNPQYCGKWHVSQVVTYFKELTHVNVQDSRGAFKGLAQRSQQ